MALGRPKKLTFDRYGMEWDRRQWNDLNLELACYREPKNYVTGKKREYHFRQAFHMCWPTFQWNDWCELQTWAYCNYRCVPVIGHSRASKCLGRGTLVLLYDGTRIPVEEVREGMLLMGDDFTPRKVLSVSCGRDRMYEITSWYNVWRCNSAHILTLLHSETKEVRDIPLLDWLAMPDKNLWKQFQVFPDDQRMVPQTIEAHPRKEDEYFGFELSGNRRFLLGDFTVTHNTFFTGHFALLDYMAAPPLTATTFTTTKFDALKTRLWGDMLRAIEALVPQVREPFMDIFKITNTSNELKLQLADKKVLGQDKFMIQGVATDSADVSAGKIRGQHADRRRIMGDEAQDIATAIFTAILNASSSADFLAILLTNPVEKESEFAKWCEPAAGWGSIQDTDLFWPTKMLNGMCLHFDGLQSPNIKAGKTIFPFMLTQDYVSSVRDAKGEDSLEWWMYIRGFFPPDGIVARIWGSYAIEQARKHVEFDFDPTPCASLDAAFDSDDCVLTLAELGAVRGGKSCCRVKSNRVIKTKVGPTELPKDYQIAREVKRVCIEHNIAPENFIMDETGNARGVLAILRVEWSPKVQGVYYGGEATTRPLRQDDVKPANEQVKYFVSELWFRASYLARDGLLTGLQNCDPKTVEDLTARRYTIKQFGDVKLMIAEPKDEMKKRLGRSCDYGDSACQLGELMARKGLLRGTGTAVPKKQWDMQRKLARKAASRYAEFTP